MELTVTQLPNTELILITYLVLIIIQVKNAYNIAVALYLLVII